MQKFILQKKNPITLVSGILISLAYISKWGFNNNWIFTSALFVASLIGVLPIAIQAYQALKIKVISIDVLVSIAVIGALLINEVQESAIVTFLFLFGAYLEQRTLRKTRLAIKELIDMAPETALKKIDDEFREVEIDQVAVGDILLVKTGCKVPVDGFVIIGEGYINQASITGESFPIQKSLGELVYAGTILENGTIQVKANRVGEETTFGKIIELVEEAQDSKSQVERFIDRFSKYYTPFVLMLSLMVGFISKDVELAITILVLGCPGALVIGVPVSHVAGIGNGAVHGILFKGSEVIHDFSRVDTMVFDKTGTLTIGNPKVVETVFYTNEIDEVFSYLVSVQKESDHPLSKAIINYVGKITTHKVEMTDVVKGKGIIANINGHRIAIGNIALMKQESVLLTNQMIKDIERFEKKGNTIVLVSMNQKMELLMGIRDQLRDGVKDDLKKLKKMGVKKLILLSGDNQTTVDLVAKELELTEAHGNMFPEDKAKFIQNLQQNREIVAFVGDGVNDSPSIALAHIGIAMGSGTDVAIETSDVVLMNSEFNRLPYALALTKATSANMLQNITIAIGVVLFLLFNVFYSEWMNMSIGMLVHEASILVVILNGMRLLRFKSN
jgi:Zn2+/Cd2+-exporting ATPase